MVDRSPTQVVCVVSISPIQSKVRSQLRENVVYTFYSGGVKIELEFVRVTNDDRDEYRGRMSCDEFTWEFDQLCSGVGGGSPEAMACSAMSFGSYYSSNNRGDDTPDWAPPAEAADCFGNNAGYGESGYEVSNEPWGEAVYSE